MEINGNKPDFYCSQEHEKYNREAWIKHYRLVTDDWFEVGFAYSLHPDARRAKKYKTPNWWAPASTPERVFVTKRTLERMMEDKRKVVFSSWENGD